MSIELHLSDHHVPVIDLGFDLAVRFGALTDSSLVARKLMDMRIVCCASPGYLERRGAPEDPRALSGHNCLLQTTSNDIDHWEFQVDGALQSIAVSGGFSRQLASRRREYGGGRSGKSDGCRSTPRSPFIDSGSLKLLFEAHEAKIIGLYAVYPPSRHLTARIRALIASPRRAFRVGRAATGERARPQRTVSSVFSNVATVPSISLSLSRPKSPRRKLE